MSNDSFNTARDAYNWCLDNGVLSKRLQEVMAVMANGGTFNQTTAHLEVVKQTGNVGLQKYSVSPRFAVLERMGLIKETGTGPCPVSGRETVFYEATLCRPKMTEAEAMKVARKRDTADSLRQENADLRKENAELRELLNLRSAAFKDREQRARNAPVAVQTTMFADAS
jgi:hypothetical protein